jgi:hypothetical protein
LAGRLHKVHERLREKSRTRTRDRATGKPSMHNLGAGTPTPRATRDERESGPDGICGSVIEKLESADGL